MSFLLSTTTSTVTGYNGITPVTYSYSIKNFTEPFRIIETKWVSDQDYTLLNQKGTKLDLIWPMPGVHRLAFFAEVSGLSSGVQLLSAQTTPFTAVELFPDAVWFNSIPTEIKAGQPAGPFRIKFQFQNPQYLDPIFYFKLLDPNENSATLVNPDLKIFPATRTERNKKPWKGFLDHQFNWCTSTLATKKWPLYFDEKIQNVVSKPSRPNDTPIGVMGYVDFYFLSDYPSEEPIILIVEVESKNLVDQSNITRHRQWPSYASGTLSTSTSIFFKKPLARDIAITKNGSENFGIELIVEQKIPVPITLYLRSLTLEPSSWIQAQTLTEIPEYFIGPIRPKQTYSLQSFLSASRPSISSLLQTKCFHTKILPVCAISSEDSLYFDPENYPGYLELFYSFSIPESSLSSLPWKQEGFDFTLTYKASSAPFETTENLSLSSLYPVDHHLWIGNTVAGTLTRLVLQPASHYFYETCWAPLTTYIAPRPHLPPGYHSIQCFAALPPPHKETWAIDGDFDMLYKIDRFGEVLKQIDLKQIALSVPGRSLLRTGKVSPCFLSIGADLSVWVGATDVPVIFLFRPDGTFWKAITSSLVERYRTVYETSIQSLSAEINFDSIEGKNSYLPLEVTCLTHVKDGSCYVSYGHPASGALVRFDAEGKEVATIPLPQTTQFFYIPTYLTADKDGTVFVTGTVIDNTKPFPEKTCPFLGRIPFTPINTPPTAEFVRLSTLSFDPGPITIDYTGQLLLAAKRQEIFKLSNPLTASLSSITPFVTAKQNTFSYTEEPSGTGECVITGLIPLFEQISSSPKFLAINSRENRVYVFHSITGELLQTIPISPWNDRVYFINKANEEVAGPLDHPQSLNFSLFAFGDASGYEWMRRNSSPTGVVFSELQQNWISQRKGAEIYQGISPIFHFCPLPPPTFRLKGEEQSLTDYFKNVTRMESLKESDYFWDFCNAVFGEVGHSDPTELGERLLYEISEFASRHKDLDECIVPILYDTEYFYGVPSGDTDIAYPLSLARLINLFSTNLSQYNKRLLPDFNYQPSLQQCGQVLAPTVGKELESFTELLTAGQRLWIQDLFNQNKLELYSSGPIDGEIVYPLQTWAEFHGFPVTKKDFFTRYRVFLYQPIFKIDPTPLINWNSDLTTISKQYNTRFIGSWFNSTGIVERLLRYEILKGLKFQKISDDILSYSWNFL